MVLVEEVGGHWHELGGVSYGLYMDQVSWRCHGDLNMAGFCGMS